MSGEVPAVQESSREERQDGGRFGSDSHEAINSDRSSFGRCRYDLSRIDVVASVTLVGKYRGYSKARSSSGNRRDRIMHGRGKPERSHGHSFSLCRCNLRVFYILMSDDTPPDSAFASCNIVVRFNWSDAGQNVFMLTSSPPYFARHPSGRRWC